MQALEQFLVDNPNLMQPEGGQWPMIIAALIFTLPALYFVFGKLPKNEFGWSTLEGKLFRLCWCFAIAFFVIMAHDKWKFPAQSTPINPNLVYSLGGAWFVLFVLSMVVSVRKVSQSKERNETELPSTTN